MKSTSYDVLHAVNDAVIMGSRYCRFGRTKLVYDAHCSLTGKVGHSPSLAWRLFPTLAYHAYKSVLQKSECILSTCQNLTEELKRIEQNASIKQLSDVPLQSLLPETEVKLGKMLNVLKGRPAYVMVCSVLPGNEKGTNKILKMARKVIDTIPQTVFFFRGLTTSDAKVAAASLDILDQCTFLESTQTVEFMEALSVATAACFFPEPAGRYAHPEVYTLLCSSAPLVAIDDGLYGHLLGPENCVQVLHNTESIAEALIQVVQEPLFSLALVTAGQQLIADKFSFSSFKHKIRMLYHDVETA